jgi:hypothetical protein
MSEFAVFVEGLTDVNLDGLGKRQIASTASKAINTITRKARTAGAREIRKQVNLPARYVSPSGKGFYISETANPASLQARITARGRPTSLARFQQGTSKPGKAGVHLEVAPGRARFMRRAFIINLRGIGGSTDPDLANKGLAIRLRPGERLQNKVDALPFSGKDRQLYLLYGPSVDQVFRSRDGTGVANDMVPKIEDDLTSEFIRLLDI